MFLCERLMSMCEGVIARLEKDGFLATKTVVLTVRFSDFQTISRSHTFPALTGDMSIIKGALLRLFLPFLDVRSNPRRKNIRLLGVRLEKLVKK